ncbi:MAG: lipocalin-like domain-containing protein [Hyphomicrobiaceae bacterium]|nr:lipocalin-like domain-containing protein [Hyphomicrobiaceae bacterium]
MQDITGTWRLVRATAVTSDGRPLPPPYGGDKAMGTVTLRSDGRMAAVLCDGRSTIPAGETREYSSYCGAYTCDGKRLVTRVDAAADAERLGTDQVRDVRFEGAIMVLRPPPRAYRNGTIEHRELYWERISP